MLVSSECCVKHTCLNVACVNARGRKQTGESSEVLFALTVDRCERRSLGNTSNSVFSEREGVPDNPSMTATAIVRIDHHSVVLELVAPRYKADAARNRLMEEDPPGKSNRRTVKVG